MPRTRRIESVFQGRLSTIINLIEKSDFSIHDLPRMEASRGVPRFNMPVELGLALYRAHVTSGRHRFFIKAQRGLENYKDQTTFQLKGLEGTSQETCLE